MSVNEMRINCVCVCVLFTPLCAGPDVDVCDNFDVGTFDPELLQKLLHSDRQLRRKTHGSLVSAGKPTSEM